MRPTVTELLLSNFPPRLTAVFGAEQTSRTRPINVRFRG
jgi:hypothetical protein